MSLILILALPFAGSLLAAVLPTNARNAEAWLAGLVALACAGLTIAQWPAISSGEVVEVSRPWLTGGIPIDLSLRMDGYAWLFAMLITIMGALIVLYARYYLSPEDPVPRFFSFFLLFMGAMLGLVLSGNLVQLVVFWELTSLSSFMLIAYWNHRLDARRGARMAFIITGSGGLCLLAGALMLGYVVGSYDLDTVLASGDIVRAHPWYLAILILIALGALTKSAQFPFHVWLPNAMAAPTPVSAYLHSATMVKAGVFLLARFWPVLAGTDAWFYIIGTAGLCSLVLGAYAAIFQQDMKGVLAYSTISHLGLITLMLALNSTLGLVAAVFHMMNHATFKASLFMAAGIVDHETGTRDMGRLSGLRRAMPITATLAMVAAASMAGVPLLNGFLSKEMFFAEAVVAGHDPIVSSVLPLLAVVASAFSVAYSLRFILQVFFGPPATDLPRTPHEPPFWMMVPIGLLVLVCLLVGILPMYTLGPFLAQAAHSILGSATPHYDLKIWHGLNLPLGMSMIAMVGGIVLTFALDNRPHMKPGRAPLIYRFNGRHTFEMMLEWLDAAAQFLHDRLFSPHLQRQMVIIVAGTFIVAMLPLLSHGEWLRAQFHTTANLFFIMLWVVGCACAIGAAHQAKYHRVTSLALSGGAGLITALTFAWLAAPDLALTQLAVEVVTVVLILLGLRWLPPRIASQESHIVLTMRTRMRRLRDLLLAILAGTGMSLLAYAILTQPAHTDLAEFFLRNALPEGHGSNVVNVILVDFRGFDTLGEITVLGIVALTVFALLRRFRPPLESIKDGPLRRQQGANNPVVDEPEPDPEAQLPRQPMTMPAVLVRLLLPIAAMVSLFFLLRGHNLPGGGFVGGLIFATAIILQYVVGGVVWVESRQSIRPQKWIAIGLLLAGGAAVSAWWDARPLMTAQLYDLAVPYLGTLHLSSVLFFDIGVYMLVIGATVLMLVALGHQTLRFRRKPVNKPIESGAPAWK